MQKFRIAITIVLLAFFNAPLSAQDQPKSGTTYYSNGYGGYKYQYNRRSGRMEHVIQPHSGLINGKFIIESDGITHVSTGKTSKIYLAYLGYYQDCRCHIYQSDDPDIQVSISEIDSKITYEWNYDKALELYLEANVYGIINKSFN